MYLSSACLPPSLSVLSNIRLFSQHAECCSNHCRVPQSLHISKLMKRHGKDACIRTQRTKKKKKKSTSSHAECKRVATLCTFTLAFGVWLSEKISFCPSVLWAFFFFRFFFPAWLIFILPLNWCVFVVVSVCPSLCLLEIGARQSVFDVPKKLLMMAFLFVYQGFPTFFILPSMTLI